MNSLNIVNSSEKSTMHLICLPYAGNVSDLFINWKTKFPSTDLSIVSYSNINDIGQILDYSLYLHELLLDCIRHIKKKFVIFGHSMGAVLAYNLAQNLEKYNLVAECVILSGSCSPFAVPEYEKTMHLLSDEDLILFLKRQNSSIHDKMSKRPLFKEIYLPKLRSDLKIFSDCTSYTLCG